MAGSFSEQLWNRVEEMNDGSLKCKFCGHQFAKDTSLSGIKWHFSGERGRGMAICGQVPKQVQEAAFPSMLGGNSTHKTMGQRLKSGWTLLLTNLILEIASAVFDQLGNALVGMVLAFVALLVATADLLIHMAPEERTSLLPCYLRPSTTHSHGTKGKKPGATIVEYFGFFGAVWQCVNSTVAYAARQKKDNPIKMTLLPLIFLLCVAIFKLKKKRALTRVLRKGIFLTPKKPLYFG